MKLETWSLTGSYFHFGEQGLGQEETSAIWSSDSLFSALIARLALLEGYIGVKMWIQPFINGTPPFLITSLFPLAGNIRFFPVPLAATQPKGHSSTTLRPKDLKKVQFVSESIYRQLLTGKLLVEVEAGAEKIQGGKIWLTKDENRKLPRPAIKGEPFKLWDIEKRPRVTLDRNSNTGTLFHVGAVHFSPECGLWFGIVWLDSLSYKPKFEILLNDLGDAGLGAERSAGYGKGTFQKMDVIELPDPTRFWTTLSRYLPREEEMRAFQDHQSVWKIQKLSGWIDSTAKRGQRRRTLNFVQEGATLAFPDNCRPPFGCVMDVRPRYRAGEEFPVPHEVFRSGLAVSVGYGG